jgi:hypothetical protein
MMEVPPRVASRCPSGLKAPDMTRVGIAKRFVPVNASRTAAVEPCPVMKKVLLSELNLASG